MNKRLEMLKAMTASAQADAFAWYALAMEYRKAEDPANACQTFRETRARFPDYLPTYLMEGQILLQLKELAAAREVLEAGISLARAQGNSKTLSELETALAEAGA